MTIQMVKTWYERDENNNWVEVRKTDEEVNSIVFRRVVDSSSFFRSLGGQEDHTSGKDALGKKWYKIVATSPDEKNRSVYNFYFD